VILHQHLQETAPLQTSGTIDSAIPTTNSLIVVGPQSMAGQLLSQHLGAGSPVNFASLDVRALDPETVVIVDGSLGPDQPGLGAFMANLHHNFISIVVAFCDENVLVQAQWVEYGAQAFVGPTASLDELGATIRRLRNGETLLGVSVREGLLSQLRTARQTHGTQRSLFASLTKREAGVLRELANGKSPEDVARINYVSLNTVRTQIRGVLAKLSTGSVVGAVAMAHQSGWMNTDARKNSTVLVAPIRAE
jgi:two-component system, NarL family, nitrate/nitrite response regulator NarL